MYIHFFQLMSMNVLNYTLKTTDLYFIQFDRVYSLGLDGQRVSSDCMKMCQLLNEIVSNYYYCTVHVNNNNETKLYIRVTNSNLKNNKSVRKA